MFGSSSSGGGTAGVQYVDGVATPTHPTGNALTFDNSGTMVDVGVDLPLPVNMTNMAMETGGNLAAILTKLGTTLTVSVNNGNANGQATMSASAPVAIASNQSTIPTLDTNSAAMLADLVTLIAQTLTPNVSDRWARQLGQVDVARVLGATLSPSNPNIVEGNIANWNRAGNGFVYANTNAAVTGGTNITACAISVFNPVASGKNIWIYSLQTEESGATSATQIRATTNDPSGTANIAGAGIITNLKFGGGNASIASVSCSASGVAASPTAPGTYVSNIPNNNNIFVESLTNAGGYLLTPGNGIAVMIIVPTSGQVFGCSIKAIEY